ncbi:hypothetical protein EJ02DRAFT_232083 [Clathrospora elynae]|uniref:Secreted protein n=1 Tax=Clathrospora elynae TaxID=706981 RepID=A0A6A5SKW5_9PLEO|nr:hypothetical protein EJ02DRAFT_232083 [Clathrospora elynae]
MAVAITILLFFLPPVLASLLQALLLSLARSDHKRRLCRRIAIPAAVYDLHHLYQTLAYWAQKTTLSPGLPLLKSTIQTARSGPGLGRLRHHLLSQVRFHLFARRGMRSFLTTVSYWSLHKIVRLLSVLNDSSTKISS